MKGLPVRFALVIIVVSAGTAVADVTSGSVAYYPFAGNALDESGNGNHGTVYGATLASDRNGDPESAYHFSGNSYIAVADSDSLDLESALTIAAWIRPDREDGGWMVVQKKDPQHGGGVYNFDIQPGRASCSLRVAGGGSSTETATGTTPIAVGEWQHIAATWDGATIRIYYNGQLEGEQPFPHTLATSDGELWIGRYYSAFNGDIDEVRIYNRALSAAEIVEIAETRYVYWFDTAAHAAGQLGSQWRTDVVARNSSQEQAELEVYLHSSGGTFSHSASISSGQLLALEDIVGIMGYTGKGCLQLISTEQLLVSGRIYNQATQGTFGQYIEAYPPSGTLPNGGTVWLNQLRQQAGRYRTNISVANTSTQQARVRIRLYDSSGNQLIQYTLTLDPRELIQDSEPLRLRAGRANLGWGVAEVTVIEGTGILTSGSVVDSVTNDATTIPMKPSPIGQ
jgi:hypothetical protein